MTRSILFRLAAAVSLILATNLSAAAEDRDDDTLDKATPINLNEDVEDALNEAGDVDYWQFEMPGRGTMTAQTMGTTDTFGQLLTESGFNLGEDDDSGSRLNFLVTTSLGAGTYYVRVSGFKDETGAYTLRVSSDVGGAGFDRDDDTRDRATPLILGEAAQDAINEPGDVDWWRFNVRTQGVVEVETTGDTDTEGSLFNEAGEELTFDSDSGEGSNFLIETTVPDGAYFVQVTGNRGSTGSYTVEANHSPGLGAERPNLRVEAVRVSKANLMPRESFTLRARVRNHGEARSESTVLRYFRSSDSTITTDDELVGSDPIGRLDVSAGEEQLIDLNAPKEAGVYYYGGCVRRVAGENRTDDNCSSALRITVTDTGAGGAIIGQHYALPLVLSTANPLQQGFVRLINRSDRSSSVRVYAIDDAGMRFEPFDVQVHARETVHFNSDDLEVGNTDKGLAQGVGDGQGEWRLDLVSDIDLLPLAYV
ncbi:MAG: PPC domain-containing protein, partial [Rhodospirillaceae bacterium]|nr:PPC domain-containing protein [Rhodospirillaceae bacterium]